MIYHISNVDYKPIGSKNIPSSCPECGCSQCLELTFYQKHVINTFYYRTTKKVSATLYCHQTQTNIPAVLWNEKIENYFNTERQKLKLESSKFRFSIAFYLVIAVLIGTILFVNTYLNHQDRTQKNLIETLLQPEKDLKLKVMLSLIENNQIENTVFTWFKVREIKGDTVFIQQNQFKSKDKDANFNLDDNRFNGNVYKVSIQQFNKQAIEGFDYANRTFSGFIMETKKE